MADMRDLRERGQNIAESLLETGQEVRNKAQEGASALGHRVQEATQQAAHRAQEMASAAQNRTEQAVSAVGQRLSSLAETIQSHTPREGVLGSAATTVAQGLDTSGRYLKEHHLSDMANDVGSIIKRHPLTAVCAFFSLGLLIGMSASARR
jgi:ElaB/YqjD/DUF883 family membrane-anchored ribosome-binding protein